MADLEKENRQLTSTLQSAISVSTLDSQISRLLPSSVMVLTISSSSSSYPLKPFRGEVSRSDLLQLINTLGDAKRNADDAEGLAAEEIKALGSLCTLLNTRSRRANGLQVFLSVMLIARGTSKQVKGSALTHISSIT